MATVSGSPPLWMVADVLAPPQLPIVVILTGINRSRIVDALLADTGLGSRAIIRLEPWVAPPCDATLWRLETAGGEALNGAAFLRRYWHRAPYAVTLRLVQYKAGSTQPEVLDEGTIGTRSSRGVFLTSVERLAMRFVRDAARGRSRGRSGTPPATEPDGLPGWLNQIRSKWRDRLMTEWWSLGTATTPLQHVLAGGDLGPVHWFDSKAGDRYLADPFPWPGTDIILCEDMPLTNGVGRIVAVREQAGRLSSRTAILDDGVHHSYPCTFSEAGIVYCVPEASSRGSTVINELDADGTLNPICEVAPHAALADPTLFRWGGRYWLACTDLDLGEHDNLCLLYADRITGPWTPHANWPVKIDVRGARPAGMVFNLGGRLFRPAQDCAASYGAAIAVHEIQILTESEFCETLVNVLRPNPDGPFPDGLHTLVHDGHRFWVDGKRFIIDMKSFRQKLFGRLARLFLRIKAT